MMRLNKLARTALLGAATMAGTFALPAIASAEGGRFHDARAEQRDRDRDEHRSDDRRNDYSRQRERSKTDVHVDINIGRTRYEPVYEDRTTRVWVEPVYRTVFDRVWVEPVSHIEHDRVWEPDRFEVRDVVYHEHGRRVIRHERVLVERGHWREVERPVLERDGHWEDVQRQELVSPGHWEYRTERVQVGESRYNTNPVIDLFAHLTR